MNLLSKFHADFQVKSAVKQYLIEKLEEIAVKKAFNGENASYLMESKQAIDKAFKDLDKLYEPKQTTQTKRRK